MVTTDRKVMDNKQKRHFISQSVARGIVNLMNFIAELSLLTSYLNIKKAEIATRKRAESPLLSDFHLD
jgi:hypothetical protein